MPVPLPDLKPSRTPQEQSRENLAFANAYWKQGNVDRARSFYEAAIQLNPENEPARIGLAWAFVAQGHSSQALADLDSIVKQHPESSATVYATRAQIRVIGERYDNTATFDKAAADVERAVKLDPMEPGARLARALIAYRRTDYDAALADLGWIIERNPEQADALIYRGEVFRLKGDHDRALVDFERAASSYRGWLRTWLLYNRAQCYTAKGKFERAIADLTEVLATNPKSLLLLRLRAACYQKKGDLEYALADYDEIVCLQPDDPAAYIMRFNVLLKSGEMDRAMADTDRLVQLLPGASGPYFLRAVMALVTAKDREKSLDDMNHAVKINPRASLYYAVRGLLLARDARLIPACRDLALLVLSYEPAQLTIYAGMDWELSCFRVGFLWYSGRDPNLMAFANAVTSEFNQKCIDLGFQRLLFSALNSRR